jgi:TRAP-type C4-dicarboxylate transport system substrate-binding protein
MWGNAMMTRRDWCGAVGALALTIICGAAVAQDSKTIVMKLATATLNDGQHEWLKRFAVAIEKNTGGRIKAEVYPASQLGAIPRMIEGTQLGSIQAFVGPPEFLVGVDQRFELLSVPGLFQSEQHAVKTIADPEFRKAFLALGANKGVVGVGLFLGGPVGFVMRTPFRTLADFKGKKIRVLASQFQTEQMTRLGATGIPLSLGDVLPALQVGTLDGAFGSLQVFTALQYYDATKYATETGHAYIISMVTVSKRWLDSLPGDLQAAIVATAKQNDAEITSWQLDFLARQRKTWVDKGGELIALSPADKAELIQRTSTIGDENVKTRPELKPLWDLLVATAKHGLSQ